MFIIKCCDNAVRFSMQDFHSVTIQTFVLKLDQMTHFTNFTFT